MLLNLFLQREGLIDYTFIANLMKWRHTSGFSVHNSVRIAAKDETGITNLAQYIMHSPFSTAKLNYNSSTGMAGVYQEDMGGRSPEIPAM